jgi:hypothetical protein
MIGVGFGSLLTNLVRMFFLATVPDKRVGAIIFFGLAACVLFTCSILSIQFISKYGEFYKLLKK